MNLYPVTIIENFYEDAAAVRQFALAQEYTFCHTVKNIDYVYPGSRTEDLSILNKKLFDQVCTKLVSVFHNAEHDVMRWQIISSFQSVAAQYDQGVIHQDDNTIFAAVLYLTPDAPLNAGTSLYKPNNKFDQKKYQKALETNDEKFKAGEIEMATDYHEMFDEVVRVNNVYNTLILYEGRHYHSANQFFGQTLKNSRLAQVFFINKIDAQKQSVFPLSRTKLINI